MNAKMPSTVPMIANTTTTAPATLTLKPEEKIAKITLDPLAAFCVQRAEQKDLADINEFLLGDFLHNEPLNNALGLGKEESKQFFAGLIESSLPSGLSYVVRDPAANNRVIAVRMASMVHRDEKSEEEGEGKEGAIAATNEGSFAEWQSKENKKVSQICGILHELESKIWHLLSNEFHCLATWLVLSVDSEYKRRGIAAALLQHRIDEIQERGCQGIVTEASALNSQKLFQKLGYIRLFEVRHSDWKDANTGERVFHCKDGTDRVTLEFMPLVQLQKTAMEKNKK